MQLQGKTSSRAAAKGQTRSAVPSVVPCRMARASSRREQAQICNAVHLDFNTKGKKLSAAAVSARRSAARTQP